MRKKKFDFTNILCGFSLIHLQILANVFYFRDSSWSSGHANMTMLNSQQYPRHLDRLNSVEDIVLV